VKRQRPRTITVRGRETMPSMTADQARAKKRMAPANRRAALEPSPVSK
jgi:hypothetical protein